MYLTSVVLSGLLAFAGSVDSKIVKTRSGTVHGGKCSNADVDYFFSIPYAKPPVGELRFAPPEPYRNSSRGVINGTIPAPSCIQFTTLFGEGSGMSEDCLFVHVWAPASATPKSKLPVKVWLYGGSNEGGGISDPTYNGCFSAVDSIVVSINYRLGPLGFLAMSDLGLTGNYATMDQLLGLRWVQENVAGFGGDPDRIVLFGESAGAIDGFIIATLPEAPQLIRAAALESGAGRELATVADSKVWYSYFMDAMNCTEPELSCLRNAPVSALQAAMAAMPDSGVVTVNTALINNGTRSTWTSLIDGKVIKEQPSAAGVSVPTLIGSNAEEGSLFVLGKYGLTGQIEKLNQTDYDAFLNYNFGPLAARVNETYSLSLFNGSAAAAMTTVLTEVSYKCPAHRALLNAEKRGIPMWTYRFAHVPSCPWFSGILPAYIPLLGATHSSEIPFVFNFTSSMPPPNGNCTFSESEQTMSHQMSRAWTNMAKIGKPGDESIWPAWSSNGSLGVVFEDSMNPAVVDYKSCAFWNQVNDELNKYWETHFVSA
ncbi:alpha/beta-hydrolase [Hypomontagnella monticulosa]|nr:alpha/beta-hydrolase [Hypomontagnella monticulosa]